jgi:hypothetical protein
MLNSEKRKEFYNQPIRLDTEKPNEVIKNFFSAYELSEIRQYLWNMVEVSITTDNRIFDEARDRENLMWFYSQLEELIEAAYLLSKRKSKKKAKRKSRKKK